MARLKGLMSSKKTLILLSAVVLVSIFGLFSIFISAQTHTLTIRILNIVTNATLSSSVNVTLINCSNGAVLDSNISTNGIMQFTINGSMNFSIRLNESRGWFVNKTDNNNGNCYQFNTDKTLYEMLYMNGRASLNITVTDIVNGRPVPNVNVKVWPTNTPSDESDMNFNYDYNFRCDKNNRECRTDENGNILLFISTGGTTLNKTLTLTHDYYDNKNTSSFVTTMKEGENLDIVAQMKGSLSIWGYIRDFYTTEEPVPSANITLWEWKLGPGADKRLGYDTNNDGIADYVYDGLTNSNGYYVIYLPGDLGDDYYELKIEEGKYETKWEDNDGNGYTGGQSIDSYLYGLLDVSGRATDSSNSRPIQDAQVNIYELGEPDFDYDIPTDSEGYFSIKIRNNTGYTVKISKNGYDENSSSWSGTQDIGNRTLRGKAIIEGKIIDKYRDSDGNEIPISSASIVLTGDQHQGNDRYDVSSSASGTFSIPIQSEIEYIMFVSNAGYASVSQVFTAEDGSNDRGNIELTGLHEIKGRVEDKEGDKATYRYLENVSVYIHDLTSGNTYKSTTGPDGRFSVNISSDSHSYYLTFNKTGFIGLIKDNNYVSGGWTNTFYGTQLTGETRVVGTVADEYSPSGSTIKIADADLYFTDADPPYSTLYHMESLSNGSFSIDLGVSASYKIKVSKTGYVDRTFPSTSSYTAGMDQFFDNQTNDYLRLKGTTFVRGWVNDEFSKRPIYSATVKIHKAGESDPTYFDTVNGYYDFWIDGTINYQIYADADRYPSQKYPADGSYRGDINKTRNLTLTSWFQLILKDTENEFGIQNARLRLYHYYIQNEYGPDTTPIRTEPLNETKINISVNCSGRDKLDGINITLEKTDGCQEYQETLGLCWRSQNTTNGYAEFGTVAIGTYNIFVDGSQIGCGTYQLYAPAFEVTSDDAGTIIERPYPLEETQLKVKVIDPIWFVNHSLGNIENANVSMVNPGPYTNATPDRNGNGVFTFHFVPIGNRNITANETHHYSNWTVYNVTNPGYENNFTDSPLILQPLPGNFSVLVINSTGSPIDDGVNVTIENTTIILANFSIYTDYNTTYSILTVDGWANFTNIYSSVYWNVTANGTDRGYNYTIIENDLIKLDNLTIRNVILMENTLLVHVYGLSGEDLVNVTNASVILWNGSVGSNVAKNGVNQDLNGTTNSSGEIFFDRIIPGSYNISINATGYNPFETLLILEINKNYFNPVLNDTTPPYYDAAWMSPTEPKQGEQINIYVHWNDNALLSQAILQLKYEDGTEENESYKSLEGSSDWSNFTESYVLGPTFTIQHAGENVSWRVLAKDSSNNWNTSMNWTEFHITDTEPPSITVTHMPDQVVAGLEVVFEATATDNHNVTEVRIYVDYENKTGQDYWNCTTQNGGKTKICSWKSLGYDYDSVHYYYAEAWDEEGNHNRDPAQELNETISYTLPYNMSMGASIYQSDVYPESIYIIGGKKSSDVSDKILKFDLTNPTNPQVVATMPQKRRSHTAAYDDQNKKIYIFGGSTGTGWLNSILEFNVVTEDDPTPKSATLPTNQRNSPSAAYYNGYIYVFGGDNGTTSYSSDIWRYDISNDSGTSFIDYLPSNRSKTAAVFSPINNKIYVIGGFNGTDIDDIVEYTPDGTATIVANMPRALEGVSASYHLETNKIYIFGGYNLQIGVYENRIFEFDPVTKNVKIMNATIANRAFASSSFSDYDNKFYIFGGDANIGGSDKLYGDIIKYDPTYSKSFRVSMIKGNLTVYVEDNEGNPVSACPSNYWPTIKLSYSGTWPNGQTFQPQTKNATNGAATFINLYPELNYNLLVNGTSEGYNHTSETVYVGQQENTHTSVLGITTLTINVTNVSGTPVSADFDVYYTGTEDYLTTCSGTQITGNTGADGLAEFERVLPCASCNLTVSKPAGASPTWNSALITVVAGQSNYVQIDPPDSPSLGNTYPYYKDVIGDYNDLVINVTTNSSGTSQPIEYVFARLLKAGTWDAVVGNFTNPNGIAYLHVIDGVYDIQLDGEERGYNSFTIENVKIGKLVFTNGTTNTNGEKLLVVDGQPRVTPSQPVSVPNEGYYMRIDTAGHGTYDSLAQGLGIFRGTYYYDTAKETNPDVKNSTLVFLYGLSIIKGNVTDKYCVYSDCKVPYALVRIREHGDVQPGEIRYMRSADENGTYSFHVTPYSFTSYWNSPVTQSYDVEVVKLGYEDYLSSDSGEPINLTADENTTHNAELTGIGTVDGWVKRHIENPVPIIGADTGIYIQNSSLFIPVNAKYYGDTTDHDGYFYMRINPYYSPYKIKLFPQDYLNYSSGLLSGSQRDLEIYLYGPSQGSVKFHVMNSTNSSLSDVNLTLVSGVTRYLQTNEFGQAYLASTDAGSYDLTTDGSYLGYGIDQRTINMVENKENEINVTLNTTEVNMTFMSHSGEPISGLFVKMSNPNTFEDITNNNGSVLFTIVPTGVYNVTFEGSVSNDLIHVYFNNSNNQSISNITIQINVTGLMAGQTNNITYVFNETRVLVKLVNFTGSALPNITVALYNETTDFYVATTDDNGNALFRQILPAENYTIIFNETQLHAIGLIVPSPNVNFSVFAGEDENTTNNITVVINDVQVRFNITNTTGDGLENVTIALLDENGSVATNAYNQTLNGTTDENGSLIIHSVPNNIYTYKIDANQSGYGIWNDTVVVTIDNVSIVERTNDTALEPMTLTVYVFNSTGGQVKENVTITVFYNNTNKTLAQNARGENLTANITNTTNTTQFTHLFVHSDEYIVNLTSQRYFVESYTFSYGLMNPSVTNKVLTFYLTERSLEIRVRYQGSPLDEGVNISLVNATDGSAVNGTNGTVIANKTGVNDSTVFEYIPDGTFNVTVSSLRYFDPAPWQFNASQILSGISPHTIVIPGERKITVIVRNSSGEVLEDPVNISIQNKTTGAVITSLNGSYLNKTGVTNSVNFSYLPDGEYKINVSADMYFSDYKIFNVSAILAGNDTYTFTLVERTLYIYLQDPDLTDLDYGVNVSLTNSTGGQLNGTDGQPIDTQTDKTDAAIFNYIPDGEDLLVSVVSNEYFSQNWSFNTTDLPTNNSHTFTMRLRTLTVNIKYFATGNDITESVTVNLINATGDVAKNTTGQYVNGTTTSGAISFSGIRDGTYNISVSSDNYTAKNVSFNPAGGDNNEVGVYLKKLDYGYFNVTVKDSSSGSLLSGANVVIRFNGTTDVGESGTTNSNGIAIVGVNTSEQDQNLTIRASKSGYDTNTTTQQYTLSDQEVKNVTVTLKQQSGDGDGDPDGGPGGGGTPLGPSAVSETINLGTVTANVPKAGTLTKSDTLKIERVEVLTNQGASNVRVTITESTKPYGADYPVPAGQGEVYKYLSVTATNLQNFILSSVTFDFKVSKSWINSNGIIPDEVYMFRYFNNNWEKLTTTKRSEDSNWYHYRATSPGFSIFAIGGYSTVGKRMSLSVSPVSLKGNECRTVYISVRNTGSATLTNLHVESSDIDCCTIQPAKELTRLAPTAQDTVSVRICAKTTADRGTYDYSVSVIADQLRRGASSKIYVTESYLESLTSQIQELEERLEALDREILNATERGYYDTVLEKIQQSREYLNQQNFDSAITMLGQAKDYYDKIKVTEPAKGYLDMFLEWMMVNYILTSIMAVIIVMSLSVIFLKWKGISRGLPEMPELPSGGEVVEAVEAVTGDVVDSLLGIVKELETRVDKIDIEGLRENERKWYNRVKMQIVRIKKSIEGEEYDKAKRHLNDAELYLKMLELNASSG